MPRLAPLLALLALSGCGRWMDYGPVRIQGLAPAPDRVYQQLLQRSVALGYHVAADPARCSFSVLARLDQRGRFRPLRASWFHVTVHPNAVVDVVAHGAHVRDGGTVIHRRLCREYTAYLDQLTLALGRQPRVAAYTVD